MKTVLVFALLAFSLCETITGGWERRSIYENSMEINEAFKLASEEYTKSNSVETDDLIPLTVYTQVVSGTNYKITFIDTKAEYPSIQEYVVYRPLDSTNAPIEITQHNEYEATSGLISYNDPTFDKIENALYKNLKDTEEKLSYISYVFPVETTETNFFMISAFTKNGEHQYVVCQDKSNSEFYVFNKVK